MPSGSVAVNIAERIVLIAHPAVLAHVAAHLTLAVAGHYAEQTDPGADEMGGAPTEPPDTVKAIVDVLGEIRGLSDGTIPESERPGVMARKRALIDRIEPGFYDTHHATEADDGPSRVRLETAARGDADAGRDQRGPVGPETGAPVGGGAPDVPPAGLRASLFVHPSQVHAVDPNPGGMVLLELGDRNTMVTLVGGLADVTAVVAEATRMLAEISEARKATGE